MDALDAAVAPGPAAAGPAGPAAAPAYGGSCCGAPEARAGGVYVCQRCGRERPAPPPRAPRISNRGSVRADLKTGRLYHRPPGQRPAVPAGEAHRRELHTALAGLAQPKTLDDAAQALRLVAPAACRETTRLALCAAALLAMRPARLSAERLAERLHISATQISQAQSRLRVAQASQVAVQRCLGAPAGDGDAATGARLWHLLHGLPAAWTAGWPPGVAMAELERCQELAALLVELDRAGDGPARKHGTRDAAAVLCVLAHVRPPLRLTAAAAAHPGGAAAAVAAAAGRPGLGVAERVAAAMAEAWRRHAPGAKDANDDAATDVTDATDLADASACAGSDAEQ